MRVQGRVAMVTGGGDGIGRACALMLAEEGANVIIADINGEAGEQVAGEIRALGHDALAVPTDTSTRTDVERAVRQGIGKFGGIDILVNNAGIAGLTPIRQTSKDTWDRTIAVHLKSMFLCSQAVLDSMVPRRWGRIVNILSRAAYRIRVGTGAYTAAKGGMLAFSKILATEVGEHGITVNNVAPGGTLTPKRAKTINAAQAQAFEAEMGVVLRPVRMADPKEIAAAVLYLCGPYSGHVTGMTIHVNGGSFMP